MEMLVLAGGFGSRLKTELKGIPKPLAPINGVPFLKLKLDSWVNQGQRKFVFLIHYKYQLMIDFLKGEAEKFGSSIEIDWIIEDQPLGTGGAIANAIREKSLTDSVLITNADTWLEGGLVEMRGAKDAVMGVVKCFDNTRYGIVLVDKVGVVTQFKEKELDLKPNLAGLINAGLYKLPTNTFKNIDKLKFSLEASILPRLASQQVLRAHSIRGKFFDIGVPEDYQIFCDWYGKKG